MAGGEAGERGIRELDQTPTWAVASVVAVIILVSILLEKSLHHIGHAFQMKKKKAMFEALEKIKTELMVLGFISLLLTFGQKYIIRICISDESADKMLPCHLELKTLLEEQADRRRREHANARVLMGKRPFQCPSGSVSLISLEAVHQLHIFIFFLAAFHVTYSAIIMALGRAKIRGWKEWERETQSSDYEYSDDHQRFRFTHETSFVKQHTASIWSRISVAFYIVSFFRQFFRSVRRADYLSMRHGFITTHLAPGSKFDFQKYIKRTLEDDFKVVVGISPHLWFSAVLFLLLNVHGIQLMLWISIMPLMIILAVGTKLQAIISQMAIDIKERHSVVQGIPLVQLTDKHFWFGRPQLVLYLIHFTLFQNSFQIIFFIWIWYEFGLHSCFNPALSVIILRMLIGFGVQFLCSYITLPLYALVSQMGSHMKKSIFDDQTSKALKKWREGVRKKEQSEHSHSPSNKSPFHKFRRVHSSSRDDHEHEQQSSSAGKKEDEDFSRISLSS